MSKKLEGISNGVAWKAWPYHTGYSGFYTGSIPYHTPWEIYRDYRGECLEWYPVGNISQFFMSALEQPCEYITGIFHAIPGAIPASYSERFSRGGSRES